MTYNLFIKVSVYKYLKKNKSTNKSLRRNQFKLTFMKGFKYVNQNYTKFYDYFLYFNKYTLCELTYKEIKLSD